MATDPTRPPSPDTRPVLPPGPDLPPGFRPRVIPSWAVPLLGLRRLWEDPAALAGALARPGETVLELGPGSGFYTLPLARVLGSGGRLLAVELQEPVRRRLTRKVAARGLGDVVTVRASTPTDPGVADLAGAVDLAVVIDVLHETGDPRAVASALVRTLRPGGRIFLREPPGHVSRALWEAERACLRASGLEEAALPAGLRAGGMAALFRAPEGA